MIKIEDIMLNVEFKISNKENNNNNDYDIEIYKVKLPFKMEYRDLIEIGNSNNQHSSDRSDVAIQLQKFEKCNDSDQITLEEGLIITIKQLRDILNKNIDDEELDLEYVGTLLMIQNLNMGKLSLYNSGISMRFLQFFTSVCVETGDMEFDVYVRDMILRIKNIMIDEGYDDDEEDEIICMETLNFDEKDVDIYDELIVDNKNLKMIRFSIKTDVILKDPSVYFLDLTKLSCDNPDTKLIYSLQIYLLKIIIYNNTDEYNILIQIIMNSMFNSLMAEGFLDIYSSPFPKYNMHNKVVQSLNNDLIEINLNCNSNNNNNCSNNQN